MLKITTLGGLTIALDQTPVEGFVSRKADALLVYLAVERRDHPRETLSNLLWDDLSQKLSLSYLRTVLASLQKQIAPYLSVSRHSIGMKPDGDYWIDVVELERVLDAAEAEWAKRATLSNPTAEALEQALALYHGEFLAGFFVRDCREFENWMLFKQEQLRSRVLQAFYRLGEYALRRKAYLSGIGYIERILALDPLMEEAHRQMMMLLVKSGQRTAALKHYHTCKEVLQAELGIEPDEETSALYNAILNGEIEAEAEEPAPDALPTMGTPFIDRPEDVRQIVAILEDPTCRLLTLVGVGGVGKTRLALEVAHQIRASYPDGVDFVPFAGVREPERLFETILNTLAVNHTDSATSEQSLIDYLCERECLLVLDNFETVLANAEALSRLLAGTQQVKLLVTSRERLNLVEEWLCPVESLPLPQDADRPRAVRFTAVQLFAQSARRVQPEFDLESELPDVIRVCRAVGGMPLAIELAASWLRVMSCGQIADEVERSLSLLVTTLRNIPERHRSIQALFESSWTMLSADEQRILRQLAIFRGGFQQAAAAAVTGASSATLLSLIDKSLLRSVDQRFEMHELLRQFAKDKLAEQPDERQEAQRKHSAYFAGYLKAAEGRLARSSPESKFHETIHEVENIRLAWRSAVEDGNIDDINRFLRPLYQLYDAMPNHQEAETLFAEAVEHLLSATPEDKAVEVTIARARVYQGACNYYIDRYALADALLHDAFPVIERERADPEVRLSLSILASSAAARGDYRKARDYYTQVSNLLRTASEPQALARALFRLGSVATMLGEYVLAERHLAEGLSTLGSSAQKAARMPYFIHRGDLDVRLGNFEQARAAFEQALELSIEVESPNNYAMILADIAQALIPLGQYERARKLCQESIERNSRMHNLWGKAYGLLHLGRIWAALGDLDAAGQSFDDAIAICDTNEISTVLITLLWRRAQIHLERNEVEQAKVLLSRGLKIASDRAIPPLTLEVLLGMATMALHDGDSARAYATAAFIAHDPAATFETRQQAEHLLAALAANAAAEAPAAFEQVVGWYLT